MSTAICPDPRLLLSGLRPYGRAVVMGLVALLFLASLTCAYSETIPIVYDPDRAPRRPVLCKDDRLVVIVGRKALEEGVRRARAAQLPRGGRTDPRPVGREVLTDATVHLKWRTPQGKVTDWDYEQIKAEGRCWLGLQAGPTDVNVLCELYLTVRDRDAQEIEIPVDSVLWSPNRLQGGDEQVHFDSAMRHASAEMATVPLAECRKTSDGWVRDDQGESGTGLLISTSGLLLTCDHVVHAVPSDSPDHRLQMRYDGRDYVVKRLPGSGREGETCDVAVLEVVDGNDARFVTAELAPDAALDRLGNGVPVEVLGYPSEQRAMLQVWHGELAASTEEVTVPLPAAVKVRWTSSAAEGRTKGMSGGPLLSPEGYVIGLLQSASPGFAYAVTAGRDRGGRREGGARPESVKDVLCNLRLADRVTREKQTIIPAKDIGEAAKLDPAWPDLVDGLHHLATGTTASAGLCLSQALSKARTSQARDTIVNGFERLGPAGLPSIVELLGNHLGGETDATGPENPRAPQVSAEDAALLIAVAGRHGGLPRWLLMNALDVKHSQAVIEAALKALESLGGLSQITPQEMQRVWALLGDWWLAPTAIAVAGKWLLAKTDGEGPLAEAQFAAPWRTRLLDRLREFLRYHDAGVRCEAAVALAGTKRPDDVAAATAALTSMLTAGEHPDSAAKACHALGRVGGKAALETLCQTLGSDLSPQVRAAAALGLGKVGSAEAVPVLTGALAGGSDSQVRSDAAEALNAQRGVAAVAALSQALRSDSDYYVRSSAAEALGEIGSADSVPTLRQAIDADPEGSVWRAAVEALGKIGGAEATVALALEGYWWALGNMRRDEVIPALTQMVNRGAGGGLGLCIALALCRTGDPKALPAVAQLLHSASSSARDEIVRALGDMHSAEAVPTLIQVLESDPENLVRSDAVKALREIGNPETVPAMLRLLRTEPNSEVRDQIVIALADIGGSEAVPALLHTLRSDSDDGVRSRAAKVLCDLGRAETMPALLRALLSDPDRHVRSAIAHSLCMFDSAEALPALTQSLESDPDYLVREDAAESLAELGSAAAVPALIQTLESDPHYLVRHNAVMLLAQLGSVAAVPALVQALQSDPDDFVRHSAANSLARLGSVAAVPALVQALQSDPHHWVRSGAAEALGEFHSAETVPLLIRTLESDPDDLVRVSAAKALGELGSVQALPVLIHAMESDPYCYTHVDALELVRPPEENRVYTVRREAANALGRIGGVGTLRALYEHLVCEDDYDFSDTTVSLLYDDWNWRPTDVAAADPFLESAAVALEIRGAERRAPSRRAALAFGVLCHFSVEAAILKGIRYAESDPDLFPKLQVDGPYPSFDPTVFLDADRLRRAVPRDRLTPETRQKVKEHFWPSVPVKVQ